MSSSNVAVGELVKPLVHLHLYSTIWKRSPDGDVFHPEFGPNEWIPDEMGVVIEIFELPFGNKKICRILMNSGGTGWTWQENICTLTKTISSIT
jgi:hypothetical protein